MDNKLVIFEEKMAICYMLDRRKAKNAMNELSKKLPAGAMEKLKQEEIDLNLIISEAKVINFLPLIENKPYILQYTLEGGDVKEQAADQYGPEICNMLSTVIQKAKEKESKIPSQMRLSWKNQKDEGKYLERKDVKTTFEQLARYDPLNNDIEKRLLSLTPYIQEIYIDWDDKSEEVGIYYVSLLEEDMAWLQISKLNNIWKTLKSMCK